MGNKANAPNWKRIKAEYIRGGISLRDMAKKHKVPYSTISKRAASEKWSDARQMCGIKMESKLTEKLANQQAAKLARMAELHDDIGEAASVLILKQIQAFPTSTSTTRIIRETVKTQEIENDDPPVFVVDTAFQLFFQRHLLFLYIQIDGFLCNTLSGKIIFQHTAKCTYKAKNYGNNPPV